MKHYTLIYNALGAGSLLTNSGGFSGLSHVKWRPAFIHFLRLSLVRVAFCLWLFRMQLPSGYLEALNFIRQYFLDEALVWWRSELQRGDHLSILITIAKQNRS